jgi:hypothetical protein
VWFAVFIRKNYEHKMDLSAIVHWKREEESRLVRTTPSKERLKRCRKLQKKLMTEGVESFAVFLFFILSIYLFILLQLLLA